MGRVGIDMPLALGFLSLTVAVFSCGIEFRVKIDIPGAQNCNGVQVNVEEIEISKPKDCVEARRYNSKSGVVTIYPDANTPLQVYCDHDTDGGGWLVFQRRQDGSVDFYQNWTSYQNGFGDVSGEFWLGLDALHRLTSGGNFDLQIDLMMFNGTKGSATYSNFSIADSSNYYRLQYDSFKGGSAGDSLRLHRNCRFSTYDGDHDYTSIENCARRWHGAWWFLNCHDTNLNGRYYSSRRDGPDGIMWRSFDNFHTLKFSAMKMRAS